ncbi:hypothetical protein V5799_005440 [Amblyomma americanum]|uniref:ABC transporter domain-containing protein n=1 Tax=Amblyomma americanum TaxID=6943 RepID=A0AAQ4DZ91_AMBAM
MNRVEKQEEEELRRQSRDTEREPLREQEPPNASSWRTHLMRRSQRRSLHAAAGHCELPLRPSRSLLKDQKPGPCRASLIRLAVPVAEHHVEPAAQETTLGRQLLEPVAVVALEIEALFEPGLACVNVPVSRSLRDSAKTRKLQDAQKPDAGLIERKGTVKVKSTRASNKRVGSPGRLSASTPSATAEVAAPTVSSQPVRIVPAVQTERQASTESPTRTRKPPVLPISAAAPDGEFAPQLVPPLPAVHEKKSPSLIKALPPTHAEYSAWSTTPFSVCLLPVESQADAFLPKQESEPAGSPSAKASAGADSTKPVPLPPPPASCVPESTEQAEDKKHAPDSKQAGAAEEPKGKEKVSLTSQIRLKVKKWKRSRPKKNPQAEGNAAQQNLKSSERKEQDSSTYRAGWAFHIPLPEMGSSIRQLYVILWKDVYVNQIRRHLVWTLLELAFTVIAMYGIGKDSLELRFGEPQPAQVFPRVQPLQLWEHTVAKILYTPDVPLLAKVMGKVREELSIPVAEAVSSADELDLLIEGDLVTGPVVGVIFEDNMSRIDKLPDVVRYRIRIPVLSFDVHLQYWQELALPGPQPVYSSAEMFALLPLQYSLERHLVQQIAANRFGHASAAGEQAQVQLQRFPYPAYYPEEFNTTYSRLVFHFGVGFLLPFASVVAKITDEKCSGMRELLSIAGTSELVYWGSHFLSSSFTTLLLSCVCMLFLFVFGSNPVLSYSDPLLVFIVLVNFNSLTILHAMFVSVLLTSSRLSTIFSMIYWIFSIAFPYLMLQNPLGRGYYLRSRASKIISSVSPGMGLHWAFMIIERFERFRLVHPSSGQIIVDNYDVVLHTEEARERIAYCPADNVLFDELTVEEHLLFFAMMKGLAMNKIRPEINLLLTDIQMSAHMSYRPSTLSDGMKRLLCVAITLLVASKSKILVLDEPTATMDPHSQREVWELLLKARRHCCILLTTQNLHEADVLADKIGIMNKGLLWCCGSPGFLRERFRAGYNIRIVKEAGCNDAAIEALIKRHMPHVVVRQESDFEVEYAIGANPGNRRLTAMFKELDRERNNLKIGPMSVAMSSLEEVLDKVRWVVPVSVLLLATYLQHMFTEDKMVSSDFYTDRLTYTTKVLHGLVPMAFITANHSVDPVMRHLKKLISEEDIRLIDVSADHTSSRLLDIADENPRTYNYRLLFGAIFRGNTTPTLWFNGQCPHAAPLLVNLYHSALLRNITGRPKARLQLSIQPHNNQTASERRHGGAGGNNGGKMDLHILLQSKLYFAGLPLSADAVLVEVLMGIFMPLALCFHAASFVVFPITERCSKFKHLQMMTGVSGAVYWLSNFLFDVVLAGACAVFFVPTICFSHRCLHDTEYIGKYLVCTSAMLAVMFISHGLSMVPFCYVASSLFSDSSFGLSVMVIFLFFVELPTRAFAVTLRALLGAGLVGALEPVIMHYTATVAEAQLVSLVPQVMDLLLRSVPTFTLTRAISKLLRLRRENYVCVTGGEFLRHACRHVELGRTLSLKYCCKDSDVTHEAQLVDRLCAGPLPPEYALVVRKLTKTFGLCRGISNISFALKRGQCLGIIGVTGAGKTELMQLLTGLSEGSSGDVYLDSLSLSRTPKEYASKLGYCPDALGLPDHLTGREIIELFCVLRGFCLDDTKAMVKNLLRIMELSSVANDITRSYTPGDKRKLCIALAIAGLPSVILLDEPSTGVDVSARAQIRRSLANIRQMTDCAILLTSNRSGVLEYRIATTYTTWGEMFSKMALIQKKYRLKEFYVSDTTLEQIFVSYARKQINFTKALASTS